MASKVASVRLDLDPSGFRRGMATTTSIARSGGKSIGSALRSGIAEGNKGGVEALKQASGAARSAVATFGSVVSVAGFTALAKGALDSEKSFRTFANGVKRGTGQVVDWRDAMARAQAVSDKLGKAVGTHELGKAMQGLFDASGDLEFSNAVLQDVGTAALSSGESLESMTGIAGELNEKFGIGAEGMNEALRSVLALSKTGGIEFEELSATIGMLGSSAKAVGIEGTAGFSKFIGMMNTVRDNTGSMKQATAGIKGIVDAFESGELAKKAKLQVGVDVDAMKKSGASFDQILTTVIAKAKGDTKKLSEIFGGGSQMRAVQAIGSLGGSVEEMQAALEKAGAVTYSKAQMEQDAADMAKSGASAFDVAMEEMRRAFEKPEMIAAMKSLASNLPQLAKVVADIVGFAVENPKTAAMVGTGAIYGKGFAEAALTAALQKAFTSGGGAAAGAVEGGLAKGGAGAAATIGAAMAAAAAVWMAYDQAQKLGEELDTDVVDSTGKVVGKADAWGEMWSKLKNDVGVTSDAEYRRERGINGREVTPQNEIDELLQQQSGVVGNPETGHYIPAPGETVGYAVGDSLEDRGRGDPLGGAMRAADKRIADEYDQEVARLASEEDAEWNAYAKKSGMGDLFPGGGGGTSRNSEQKPAMDAAQARLMAEMLAGKTLKVEVQNADAIRGSGPIPTPNPGPNPR